MYFRNLLNIWKYRRTKLSANLLKHIYMTINLDTKRKIVVTETSVIKGLDDSTHNANIYCIDDKNNIVWRVDSDKGIMDRDSFVYIKETENGIYAQRFFGTIYMIDPKTGESEAIDWCK